ncbi:type II 3-dehydroquinate dehydratase [Culicoidibacter larvae]|uniref:3-dehydroquinate dehydratase n=1 Tax=Culicoidibacter larvae TaxID=2579976 RepID=A0A5R8QCF3_9FIRM|nr:type II 3-dehydroquinate dehydratase [Culicoidibacter larvae]TLG74205.1 3-dehydroquinate dehydratase [Culicoidibacter larvae]
MKIFVINGPNINMTGIRNHAVYGYQTFDDLQLEIYDFAKRNNLDITIKQSNHEGLLIDWLQQAFFEEYDGIILNAGAFTHYSYALRDAVESIRPIPVIEVHMSDIYAREDFRKNSVLSDVCDASVVGKGFGSYIEALELLLDK